MVRVVQDVGTEPQRDWGYILNEQDEQGRFIVRSVNSEKVTYITKEDLRLLFTEKIYG